MDRWICKYVDKETHTIRNYYKFGFKTFESIILDKKKLEVKWKKWPNSDKCIFTHRETSLSGYGGKYYKMWKIRLTVSLQS